MSNTYGRKSPGLWYKIVHMEPALLRGLVMAVFGLLAGVGIVTSDALPDQLLGVLLAVLALVQALWTRESVVPEEKVVVYLDNPVTGTGLQAGKAVPAPVITSEAIEEAVYRKAA